MSRYWVYDIETLVNCTIFVFEDYKSTDRKVFVLHQYRNNYIELIDFLNQCKKDKDWFFGYNNIAFDAQIIEHVLENQDKYLGLTPTEIAKAIHDYAQSVIEKSNRGDWLDYAEWNLSIRQVDIFKLNHWDNEAKRSSLKWIQYSMDWHNVEEMPHHHSKPVHGLDTLTRIISYCINDVSSTKAIFLQDSMKKQIQLRSTLSKEYKLHLYSASEPRISKEMFIHFLSTKLNVDKKSIKKLRTKRDYVAICDLILPYIKFETPEFCNMLAWFKSLEIEITEGKIKGPQHVMKAYGVKTVYALGGIHGCTDAGIYESDEDSVIVTADVTSFYPNLAIRNKWSPAHIPQAEFCELYEWFFEERKKYDKKNPLNYLFKIILNSKEISC